MAPNRGATYQKRRVFFIIEDYSSTFGPGFAAFTPEVRSSDCDGDPECGAGDTPTEALRELKKRVQVCCQDAFWI